MLSKIRRFLNTPAVKIMFSFDYYMGFPSSHGFHSIDTMKFKKVRDRLLKEKIISRKHFRIPEMVSYEDMALVHTEEYIKSIQDPLKVARMLRIGAVDPWDSFILEYFRTVTGGTILAMECALKTGGTTFNLGGGFHHAYPDQAAGFCLINDVAIAIEKARIHHDIQRIMIIDLDYHQGDGNLLFFQNNPEVFTFSMHATKWLELEKENNIDILLQHGISGTRYLKILQDNLLPEIASFEPQLVFYIAGADTYEHDTLCDLNISREDMLERNLLVWKTLQTENIPMVIVAGGGYGLESWKIYYDYLAAIIKGKKIDF